MAKCYLQGGRDDYLGSRLKRVIIFIIISYNHVHRPKESGIECKSKMMAWLRDTVGGT
jgi:hypothetical protein